MTRWLRGGLLAFALMMAGVADAQTRIDIASRSPGSLSEFLGRGGKPVTVTAWLYMPADAKGPVPALVLKHGTAGLAGAQGDNIRLWAQDLNRWGVAALVVDSFGARGGDPSKIREFSDLVDAFTALKLLAADPRIDPKRIGIMGWSRGGAIALQSSLETARLAVLQPGDPSFAAHIALYGAAMPQYRDTATDRSPILLLHGEADDLAPAAPTREFADWLRSMGGRVDMVTYPGAAHDFDVLGGPQGTDPALESVRRCDVVIDLSTGRIVRMDNKPQDSVSALKFMLYFKGCLDRGATLRADPAARADVVKRVHAFLVETLKAR